MAETLNPTPNIENQTESQAWIDSMPFDDQARWDYYEAKGKSVEAGEPTWLTRDFEAEGGLVEDFYNHGSWCGFVFRDETDFVACLPSSQSDGPTPVYVGASLDQARRAIVVGQA